MANIAKDLDIALKVAEEGAKIARKVKVKPTVKEAERIAFPGIYDDPRVIAEKAASRVAPESPAMKQLFGVTRDDLYEMSKGRKGNIIGKLPGEAKNPKGSKAAEKVMTKKNEQRLLDALYESEKYPELIQGMDPWYTMDPLYKQMVQLVGPEKAVEEYKKFNTLLGMASPGSEVTTEIPRGTAAYFLQKEGRFPDFEKYIAIPNDKRSAVKDFPTDIINVPGHIYHTSTQSAPMSKYLKTGEMTMKTPKVPMYIEASGVPETGFQTDIPVGDAHWSRAVGLADTRTAKRFDASVSTPEMSMLAPWWRKKIAGEAGLESVPAQARTWGLFSPQTGVTTPIGKPKLEMISDKIMETAIRLNISPEDARDLVLTGKTYAGKKKGGKISLGKRLDNTEKEKGFLGEIQTPRGDFMTEMSVGEPNTDELFRPSIVPNVHPAELNYMIQTGKVPTDLYPISQRHAEKRITEGKSPFWNEKEDAHAHGGTTYADGGSTHRQDKPLDPARQKPSFFPKDSKPHKQGFPIEYEEYYPRSTKPESELLDQFRKDELTAKDYFKAAPTIAKTAGKMLKEQAKEELPTYLEPRAIPDIALNALATGVGSVSDLAFLGSGVDRPPLGSEQLMDLLNEYGLTSGVKRPLAENLLTIASPKVLRTLAIASPKVLRTAESGLNALRPAVERPFTPITTTVEAVAPDLAKFKPRDFQEYVTNRMISNQYGGTPMNFMGNEMTKKLPAQGVYFNDAGQLETNPMMAIDVPNVSDISKAKELRADIASAGKALNQESMAGIRFLPLTTNRIEDATAILVKPKSGKISNEDVIKLGNEFGNSMVVSHNPRLGGVVLAPFDKPQGELQIAQSKIRDLFGPDMNIRAGHSDLQRDRFLMPKKDYAKEGARKVPKSTQALREELKKAEALRYREPSFLSDTNPLTGGTGD